MENGGSTFPTKKDLREVYVEYDSEMLEAMVEWLHENWHAESMETDPHTGLPLRYTTFGNTYWRLVTRFGKV